MVPTSSWLPLRKSEAIVLFFPSFFNSRIWIEFWAQAIVKFSLIISPGGPFSSTSVALITFILDRLHEDLNIIKDKPFIETKDYGLGDSEKGSIESW